MNPRTASQVRMHLAQAYTRATEPTVRKTLDEALSVLGEERTSLRARPTLAATAGLDLSVVQPAVLEDLWLCLGCGRVARPYRIASHDCDASGACQRNS